jgi:anti-sigma28 factor (negative regulator of flagellin synthesis)
MESRPTPRRRLTYLRQQITQDRYEVDAWKVATAILKRAAGRYA